MLVSEEMTDLYTRATQWAMSQNHVVGEKKDYYITLEELQRLMEKYLLQNHLIGEKGTV